MPLAVTHILVVIFLIEIFRAYVIKDNKKFPRYYILIGALGAVIPDFDIGAYYIFSFFGFSLEQIHRMFTHTIFIPIILLIIGLIFWKIGYKNKSAGKKHLKISYIFFILSFGSAIHLVLDMLFSEPLNILYPFYYSIGINWASRIPAGWMEVLPGTVDGILILLWIAWMEFKLKISEYI